jgi:cation:H+ antiporter
LAIVMLVLGFVVLTAGAELLVRGSSKLATAMGISPLVVGLTVVAFGTSAPELVVSMQSVFAGQPDVAMGNVVGSNIFNVLFILGISALIVPLRVSQQLIRFDVPLMVALSFMVLVLGYDGRIGQIDGLVLTLGLATYTSWAIIKSRKEQADVKAEYEAEFGGSQTASAPTANLMNLVLLLVGLGMLVLGSRWLVSGATTIARDLGISELVIGLTIIAAGTSLPEVATSIMAAIRGERDIAVGNVVGSNLFNIMGVLGVTSLFSTGGVAVSEAAYRLDIPVMVAVAVACLPIFFTGHVIARWEGGLFLAYYVAYTASIVVAATVPAFTRDLSMIMLGVVLPLTVITLIVGVVRSVRNGNTAET